MAAAPIYLTADQFERTYGREKPYYEYWYGEALQKPMPTLLHSYIQVSLAIILRSLGWRVGTETALHISPLAHPIPDLIANPSAIEGPYPTKPVALCVEILSPQDDLRQTIRKAAHYLDWGIGHAWIVDPENRRAFSMSRDNPVPQEIGDSSSLTAGTDLQITVPLSQLFGEVDKMLRDK